jgi:MoaA/NifB/PqqE/SkfB family radical SAM enzyme
MQAGGLALGALGLTADRSLFGPVYAQVSVADVCNYRCLMCGYHPPEGNPDPPGQFGGKAPGLIPEGVFGRLVEELWALGTRQVDLVGRGEPLLHPGLAGLVERAKRRGFTVTLTTNGSRLDEEVSRLLLAAGLDRIRISLNAGRADTYPKLHINRTTEDFRRVCTQVRRLLELRRSTGAPAHVAAAYVIGSVNYREVSEMIETVSEIGADAAHFQFCVRMAGADAMEMSAAQHRELVEAVIPTALERARALGVETDLSALASSPPAYLLAGGPNPTDVVPCYIGYFFTLVLGNGGVMGCCQTLQTLGNAAEDGFAAVWNSGAYRRFRRAGRRLPEPDEMLSTCECDSCFFRPHNVTIHNLLHPFSRIPAAPGERAMALSDLARLSRLKR